MCGQVRPRTPEPFLEGYSPCVPSRSLLRQAADRERSAGCGSQLSLNFSWQLSQVFSTLMALWRVLVPIALPGIVATGIYTFMQAWNEFLFALTLTKTMDMRTVPVGIQMLMGQHSYEWNEMMAMSVLGSLPLLVLYLVAQRYFLAGMTAGSVKA